MRTTLLTLVASSMICLALGCEGEPALPRAAEVKKVPAGKNVAVEIGPDERRVLIEAEVCLREGQLEQFLTRKRTKEHEAVLAADVDGRDIHKALLATGAEPGSPVQFTPKYKAASGTVVKVFVRWEDKGKLRTEPASRWVQHAVSKKDLMSDWVFGGSRFVADPEKVRPDYYLANDGDLICVSNFESALLDLPVDSPNREADLMYLANTDRIPARGTKVTVILEPVLKKAEK